MIKLNDKKTPFLREPLWHLEEIPTERITDMAIDGLLNTFLVDAGAESPAEEATKITLLMLEALEVVINEDAAYTCLLKKFAASTELGDVAGRLYLQLPAAISTVKLLKLANKLSQERGYSVARRNHAFWVPNSWPGAITSREFNGYCTEYTPQVALYAADSRVNDSRLHFIGHKYDEMSEGKKIVLSQLQMLEQKVAAFASKHPGAYLRAADHRDFLVWYIMDLIQEIPPTTAALHKCSMLIPSLGRRTIGEKSQIGFVANYDGVVFGSCDGDGPYSLPGIGLSAGFVK